LLVVATGNIKNAELEQLFSQNLQQLIPLFETHSYIELSRTGIIVYQ
jgi:predicted nuclease of predicted toxin-antitoxin system